MTQYLLHYMGEDLKGGSRHLAIMIEAKSESDAYIEFHRLGYSGWYATSLFGSCEWVNYGLNKDSRKPKIESNVL